MKKSILILLILASLPVTAQNSRFYGGFYGSPDVRDCVFTKGDYRESFNDMWKIRPAYTIGFSAGFQFRSGLSFETGVQYSLRGTQTGKLTVLVEEPDPAIDFTEIRTVLNRSYLGIPLLLRFNGRSHKWFFTASSGFVPGYLISDNLKTIKYGDERSVDRNKNNIARKFTITALASAGIGCHLTEQVNLKLEPVFQYDMVAVVKDSNCHYWNLGLRLGIAVMLKEKSRS